MIIPDELALMTLFGSEPEILDAGVPYYYNQATYTFTNNNNEQFITSISPSFGDVKIQVFLEKTEELVSFLNLRKVQAFEILSDKKNESKIKITIENCLIHIDFKPKYKIFISQCD